MIKIGLIGCPGTGKTTVASKVSEELDIPLIVSRSFTKEILERDSYDYAPNNFVENFLANRDREFELVTKRIEKESKSDNFITDRTTLEQFAYSLLRIETYSDEDIVELEQMCRANVERYTHLFYFNRPDKIKNNGLRTVNTFFQMKVDFLIRGIIDDWEVEIIDVLCDVDDVVSLIVKNF